MTGEQRASGSGTLLTSAAFVLAVALLVLNDWVLKPALGNWFTGKLSDVAGLFAFPLLWTALAPRRRDAAFALTAVGFMVWKSPLSEPPLAAWNALGLWPLARVVDYTDWGALVVLVPSYWLGCRRTTRTSDRRRSHLLRRAGAVASGAAAFMAFAATSVAPARYALHDPTEYLIPATGREVRTELQYIGVPVGYARWEMPARRRAHADTVRRDVDTLQVWIKQPPERDVAVTVELSEVAPSQVRLKLLAASAFGPEPRSESIHRAFRAQVFEPLRERVARTRTPKE